MQRFPIMGAACLDGWIACSTLPRAEVERLLPAAVRLADVAWTSPALHPIVCICGTLTETTIFFGGQTIPTGVDYREFVILIPLVHHRDGREPLAFVLQMYSSVPTAVLVGNAYYGFSKRRATIRRQGPTWLVTDPDGMLLAYAALEPRAGALADLAAVRSLVSLPLLGRKADGTFITSRFEWDFDDALVHPAASCVSLASPFVSSSAPLECDDVPGHSFEVERLRWRLSWPSTT